MLINRLLRSTIGRIGSTRGFAIYRTPAPAISGVLEVRQTLHISSGLAGLATAFDKLPKDSDGFTREELQRSSPSTSSEIMDAIFELFDNFPKDGKISYNELCAYLLLHAEGVTEAERSEFTFSICDANGDNKISKEELAGVVETLAYAKSKNWSEAKDISLGIVADAFAKSQTDLDIHAFTEWSRGQSEQAQVNARLRGNLCVKQLMRYLYSSCMVS